jgi:hypothetical protein
MTRSRRQQYHCSRSANARLTINQVRSLPGTDWIGTPLTFFSCIPESHEQRQQNCHYLDVFPRWVLQFDDYLYLDQNASPLSGDPYIDYLDFGTCSNSRCDTHIRSQGHSPKTTRLGTLTILLRFDRSFRTDLQRTIKRLQHNRLPIAKNV